MTESKRNATLDFNVLVVHTQWIWSRGMAIKHQRRLEADVSRGLAAHSNRDDLLTNIIQERDNVDISNSEIAAHSSEFVIAGSETTATTLFFYDILSPQESVHAGTTLQRYSVALARYEDITATKANSLKYLRAVAQEAMRLYPPLPPALPRVVPRDGATVDGHFLPPSKHVVGQLSQWLAV